MIRLSQIKIEIDPNRIYEDGELQEILMKKTSKILRISYDEIKSLRISKHSIDARKKPVLFDIYVVDVALKKGNEAAVVKKCRDKNVALVSEKKYDFLEKVIDKAWERQKLTDRIKRAADKRRIVIVGFGPAGMFCGYELARFGFKPVILERGAEVDARTEAVEKFWKTGELDTATNVQFGEGGAGTFSDGKLNTMVKDKAGRGEEVLDIFTSNGAPEHIKYESKPHIGTDILVNVVKSMRQGIIRNGGEVLFDCKVTDILTDEEGNVTGVKYFGKASSDGSMDVGGQEAEEKCTERTINCSAVVLAIGHSARDTFMMLRERHVEMTPKPFAVGFRVEHPQSLINRSQYGIADPKALPAAPYKLTTTTASGRGVYSFCMCPGGYVVNASSEEGRLAVNGMSYSKRDGCNANSAIIITVDPKDFGGDDVLSGVEFQRGLEKKAYDLAKGRIPVEYYGDFKKHVLEKESESDIIPDDFAPQMKGAYEFADVHSILPDELNSAFVEGMENFGRIIKGYNDGRALVSGVESRTSSPVRITRGEDGQSVNVKGLYPCGEGAGYAGGIMSAAMDGIRIAELLASAALGSAESYF